MTSHTPTVLRYSAFTESRDGGNPAGVVFDARDLSDERMLALAAEVGYSETAFLSRRPEADVTTREFDVRYFSPKAEVPFCGHATIAAAVALVEREGTADVVFQTRAGPVIVRTGRDASGGVTAALTSVAPYVDDVSDDDLASALAALRWSANELDPALPPKVAYAGARHLILAARSRQRLGRLDYDFEGLKRLMLHRDLTTVALVWRAREDIYHARNPFPVGGVVEDPATGAAAAAFGAYLRELRRVTPPTSITLLQGDDIGRPSRLVVDIPRDRPEITVSGRAVAIDP